ncbi:phage head-tail joining protein [Bdellovibrio bacteriovorus]|uniref:phage head-tail joining protein n=1 Tax=Bdellovibrio bacteriovorus TaxID=959 RepID=UPI0035A5F44A
MSAEEIAKVEQHIEDLEAALADPALSVEYEGKKLTFENSDGIQARIDYFKSKLKKLTGAAKGRGPRRVTVYTNSRKGL